MLPYTVVIVDDHAGVRKGLRLLIECDPTLKLIGEATDGADAIRVVHALRPDLLLMDIKMPKMSGLEVLQYLRNEKNPVAIILLSGHDDRLYVEAAKRLGATAFVAKMEGSDVLMNAIHAAQRDAVPKLPAAAPIAVVRDVRLLPC
ncbi:MAG: degU 2 [Chthonomonadaceae bacterium]|nr:degU 2 [Chthonomonadaceae bacterium]